MAWLKMSSAPERAIVKGNRSALPFFAASQKAKEVRMKIVFLDRPIKKQNKFYFWGHREYINFIRERSWMKKIAKYAKPDDIVIMHPNHLLSIQKKNWL